MIKLSVNVNKIATLRNARGSSEPSPLEFARAALEAGADGITVHPRPDERHIRRSDVFELRPLCTDIEFNIEGYPDARYLEIVRLTRPHQATLVPDPPGTLTSNAGWDVRGHATFLAEIVAQLHSYGARVSLFLEPDPKQVEHVKRTRAERFELYTEHFARAFAAGGGRESFERYAETAQEGVAAGLGINAGHDLNMQNLVLMRELPGLLEVSIGHALVIDGLRMGWHNAVRRYRQVLRGGE